MLSAADAARLAKIVVAGLSAESLLLPSTEEREPAFTARVLMPIVQRMLEGVGISGITLHGDGRSSAPSTSLPSCEFKPDIALLYRRRRMVAFEV